ncbi:MAG: hypothetical protein F6K18_17940 [Okeania sp. SIO2C2]|uniref:hypothetical protein n=1 Tax=Okeania sp. SIO2C2 TaxID=2607787 RepID=UPI0013BB767C|nr:hypothetical protein [Okeania sp. SIO2C2]NEP88561.1 hypothetical protein [Okeania sp. SIO2C2]
MMMILSREESGVRSQESGVRSQESGVRSQESGVRSQESGVRSQERRGGESFCRSATDQAQLPKNRGIGASPFKGIKSGREMVRFPRHI